MSRVHRIFPAAAAAVLVAAAPAYALIHPKPLSPKNGHHMHRGTRPTFYVVDTSKKQSFNTLYLYVTKSKKTDKCGGLHFHATGKGIYEPMYRVKGHKYLYAAKTPGWNFPGYWSVTRGTYYWQASRNAAHGNCSTTYSKVKRIVVR